MLTITDSFPDANKDPIYKTLLLLRVYRGHALVNQIAVYEYRSKNSLWNFSIFET